MAHKLSPSNGSPCLEPAEIARRLHDEFASCKVDSEQGRDDVGDMLAKLLALKAPQSLIDEVMTGRDRALRITVADDALSDNDLSFFVRPGDGFLIGYRSAQHEAAARTLLLRCALALGYEVKLV
jgi:hypothetical protein